MNAPELRRTGDTFEFLWPDVGYGIGFTSLREKSGEVHGEIWVGTSKPTTNGDAHIAFGSFNLSSLQTRTRMAKDLQTRTAEKNVSVWEQMLEFACRETARLHREGEPCYDLSEGEVRLETPFLVTPILPKGVISSIYADGGSGKGWLALAICISLRLGGEVVPGIRPVEQCNSLYLDWETDFNENKRRIELLHRGLGIHARPDGIYYRRMYRALADDIAAVRRLVDSHQIGLVVVDSAAPATAGELRDSDAVLRFHSALRQLATTTLMLGHVSKETAASKTSDRGRQYGSVFYDNLSRSCWEGRSDPEMNPIPIGLFHRKGNMAARSKPLALSLCFDDAAHSVVFRPGNLNDSAKVSEHADLSLRIAWELRRGAMTTKDLAEELGANARVVGETLRRDAKKNRVVQLSDATERTGRGNASRWGLPADSLSGTRR